MIRTLSSSTTTSSTSSSYSDYSGQFIGFSNSPAFSSLSSSSSSSSTKYGIPETNGFQYVDKQGLRGIDGQEYEEKKKLILLLLNRVNEIELEEVSFDYKE